MTENTVSRRDFLKKGAVVGGAAVWMTPVVQTVGMRPAFAQAPSPGDRVCYAIKYNISGNGLGPCDDIFNQTDTSGPGQGQCLDVDASVTPVAGGCSVGVIATGGPGGVTVTVPDNCVIITAALKASQPCFGPNDTDAQGNTVVTISGNVATFTRPIRANGNPIDISHVEIVFCCE